MPALEGRGAGGEGCGAGRRGGGDGDRRDVLVKDRWVVPLDCGQRPVVVGHAGQLARSVVGVRQIHDVVDLNVLDLAQFGLQIRAGQFQGCAAG